MADAPKITPITIKPIAIKPMAPKPAAPAVASPPPRIAIVSGPSCQTVLPSIRV